MGKREKVCRDAARPPGRSSSSIWGLRLAQAVRSQGEGLDTPATWHLQSIREGVTLPAFLELRGCLSPETPANLGSWRWETLCVPSGWDPDPPHGGRDTGKEAQHGGSARRGRRGRRPRRPASQPPRLRAGGRKNDRAINAAPAPRN